MHILLFFEKFFPPLNVFSYFRLPNKHTGCLFPILPILLFSPICLLVFQKISQLYFYHLLRIHIYRLYFYSKLFLCSEVKKTQIKKNPTPRFFTDINKWKKCPRLLVRPQSKYHGQTRTFLPDLTWTDNAHTLVSLIDNPVRLFFSKIIFQPLCPKCFGLLFDTRIPIYANPLLDFFLLLYAY